MSQKRPFENQYQTLQPPATPDYALCRQGELMPGIDGYSGAPSPSARPIEVRERDLRPCDYLVAAIFGVCAIVATYLASTLIAQQKVALIDLLH